MEKTKKFSRKREAVYNVICSTKSHPNAAWVYERVRQIYPDISLATVYRNIAQFREEGRLITVAVVNGQERIDGCTEPHAHFVCDSCAEVTDIDAPLFDELDGKVSALYGGQVSRHELLFRGQCKKCKLALRQI